MKSRHRVALLLLGLMMTPVVSARSEDFYETRLRDGQEASRQKLFVQAVDELRIASFGFLDRPVLLSESLARLSLAQSAAGRAASGKGARRAGTAPSRIPTTIQGRPCESRSVDQSHWAVISAPSAL